MRPGRHPITNEHDRAFARSNPEVPGMLGPLVAIRRMHRRIWLRLSWKVQTLTVGLSMTMASFGLSMLVAFLAAP